MNPSDASGHDSTGRAEIGASSSEAPPNVCRIHTADQDDLRPRRCAAENRCAAPGGAFDEIKQRLVRPPAFGRGRHPNLDRIAVSTLDLRSRRTGNDTYPQGRALSVLGDRIHERNVPDHRPYQTRQRRRFGYPAVTQRQGRTSGDTVVSAIWRP